jgi:DNA-binding IclR family transcriptional regulator
MSGGRRADTQPTVVGRALAILDSFSRERPVLRLVEISRSTGLPANTVLRLVRQLCEWGAVERTADLRYRIGPRLGRLAELRGEARVGSDR